VDPLSDCGAYSVKAASSIGIRGTPLQRSNLSNKAADFKVQTSGPKSEIQYED
jgi:hypothetical protein